MLPLLYSLVVKLLSPTSLSVISLLTAAGFKKRVRLSGVLFWMAVAILMVCGNGWVADYSVRTLERRYPPPNPVPQADCILVLSGGTLAKIPPRPTIEVSEAGDRVLYGAHLFRQQRAPRILCTGGVATGGIALRPLALDMAELLESIGVPKEVILTETEAADTHQHARNLEPVFRERKFQRVLLVTSAAHMPRSMGVFNKLCPGIEFIAAATDFQVTDPIPAPWYRELFALIPTPENLVLFSNAMHEYLGIAYYKLRGWM